jgi:hypothetical protein
MRKICCTGLFILFSLAINVCAEDRFTEDSPPPTTGWQSAMKFFSKTSYSEASAPDNSIEYGGSAFLLDHVLFVDNKDLAPDVRPPKWGISAGYEWDKSWYGTGIYMQYSNYKLAEKYSVTGGFYFPRIETGFPLYIRAHVGLGYISDVQGDSGMTLDYNASLGLRLFASSRWLFNLELGSKNYTRILKSETVESIVVASGLAITF